MKSIIVRTGLLLAIPLLFSTCNKIDWNFFGSHGKNDCLVESYHLLVHYPGLNFPFLFEKKFNHSGDRVTEINCSFNNILPVENFIHFNLRVVYAGRQVYLINKESPYDTTMKVYLDPQGRVRESISNSDFIFHNRFSYKNNKLWIVEASTQSSTHLDTCEYDSRGNILSIAHTEGFLGQRDGYFFQYDYSRKAKEQFYFDEIRDLNNDFALLQYLGCFPELVPVNVRTHTLVGLEDGSAFIYDKMLMNHRFDAKGKLLGYDVMSAPDDLYYSAEMSWKCGK